MQQPELPYNVIASFTDYGDNQPVFEIMQTASGDLKFAIGTETPVPCAIRPGRRQIRDFFKQSENGRSLVFMTDAYDFWFKWVEYGALSVGCKRASGGDVGLYHCELPAALAAIEASLTQRPQGEQLLVASSDGWALITKKPDDGIQIIATAVSAQMDDELVRRRPEHHGLYRGDNLLQISEPDIIMLTVVSPRISEVGPWIDSGYIAQFARSVRLFV